MNRVNTKLAIALALAALACGAIAQKMPTGPIAINVVDVAGNLALTQDALEAYKTQNPKLVSKITFTKAPAPELPGKLKAMQADLDARRPPKLPTHHADEAER